MLGLGYVGLPLAVEFAHAGFEVVGIDVQQIRSISSISGHSYVKDVKDGVFAPLVKSGKLRATSDFRSSKNWTLSISASRHRCGKRKTRI